LIIENIIYKSGIRMIRIDVIIWFFTAKGNNIMIAKMIFVIKTFIKESSFFILNARIGSDIEKEKYIASIAEKIYSPNDGDTICAFSNESSSGN